MPSKRIPMRRYEVEEPTLTRDLRDRLIGLVRNGVPWKFAASSVLIKRSLLEKWWATGQSVEDEYTKRGKLPDTITPHERECRLFYIDATVAGDVVVAKLCMSIHRAAKSDWHAARWLLEVREPKTFKEKGASLEGDTPANDMSPQIIFTAPDNGRGPKARA